MKGQYFIVELPSDNRAQMINNYLGLAEAGSQTGLCKTTYKLR